MPKIAVYEFLTFFAVMFDVIGTEPPHLHVYKTKTGKGRYAKIWIDSLIFAEEGSLTEKDLLLATKLVESNREVLLDLYAKARAGEKIKTITLKLKKRDGRSRKNNPNN